LLIFIHLNLATVSQSTQTVNQPPVFVYVKTATAKVSIKSAGQSDWNEIQKFGRLFSGDSLKIPKKATVLLGDGSSSWKEFTGPKAMIVIETRGKESSEFGQILKRLYLTFFVEPHRRPASQEGVRNTESLLLAMPDTVYAYAMPDTFRWIKSAPWWMKYQVQITRNQQTVLDTVVQGNTLKLNQTAGTWKQPGHYKFRVKLPQGALLPPEADSTVIHLRDESHDSSKPRQFQKLKNRVEKKGRRDDYFALLDFCLNEKLYLEAEHDLIQRARKFPDHPEPKVMLYAYYSSFLPEDIAERLVMERLKGLQ
jgi:hypothetical protein